MIQEGVDLVSAFEGFSSTPYRCPGGVWTIGFGTTRYLDGRRVTQNDPECTREQAEGWLNHELSKSESYAVQSCCVYLNPMQRAALASFIYNVGAGAFRASTLRKRVNEFDWEDVPYQLSRWNKSGGRILSGLVRRRAAEAELWKKGIYR